MIDIDSSENKVRLVYFFDRGVKGAPLFMLKTRLASAPKWSHTKQDGTKLETKCHKLASPIGL
jgi:hypothetical protein